MHCCVFAIIGVLGLQMQEEQERLMSLVERQEGVLNHSLALALARVEETQSTHIHYLTADIGITIPHYQYTHMSYPILSSLNTRRLPLEGLVTRQY